MGEAITCCSVAQESGNNPQFLEDDFEEIQAEKKEVKVQKFYVKRVLFRLREPPAMHMDYV